jgi:hypothetical protein
VLLPHIDFHASGYLKRGSIMKKSSICAALVALGLSCSAQAAIQFVDWNTIDTSTATAVGAIGSVTVTFSGTQLNGGVTNSTSNAFSNGGIFTPNIVGGDHVEFVGLNPAASFVLSFSQAVVNPIIHVVDLSSLLVFSNATPSKVSGSGSLTVVGNSVPCDGLGGSAACAGTLAFTGVYTSIAFTALNSAGGEGILFQTGFDPVLAVSEPATLAMFLAGIGAVVTRARRRQRNATVRG